MALGGWQIIREAIMVKCAAGWCVMLLRGDACVCVKYVMRGARTQGMMDG